MGSILNVGTVLAGFNGAWSTETLDDGGTVARFTQSDGNLAGFALTGIWAVEKQVLSNSYRHC